MHYALNHVVYEFPKVLSFNIGIWNQYVIKNVTAECPTFHT